MNLLRTLWANVEGNPVFMRKMNGWLIVFLIPWTVAMTIPGTPLYDLGKQVGYVTFISHVALILGCLGAYQAARVEVKQDDQQAAPSVRASDRLATSPHGSGPA